MMCGIFFLISAPSSPVESFAVVALDSRTIRATWNSPPSTEINGVITFYYVNFFIAETLQTFHNKTYAVNTFFILEDAHPYYTYSVKVSAVTVAPGPYTSVYNVTTPQDGMYS